MNQCFAATIDVDFAIRKLTNSNNRARWCCDSLDFLGAWKESHRSHPVLLPLVLAFGLALRGRGRDFVGGDNRRVGGWHILRERR
jgi:hypothetical protein